MLLLVMGLCTAFNFIVIFKKWQMKRYCDFLFDMATMVIICILFSGTFSALAVGMVASMAVSIYLYFKPLTFKELIPELPKDEDEEEWEDDN